MNILETARRAVELINEAAELAKKLKELVASSGQALTASEQSELNALLAEAKARREAANAELDEVLTSLGA